MREITCPYCEQPFRPARGWQRFCSKDHQQAWHRRRYAEEREAARPVPSGPRREVPAEIMEALMAPRRAAQQAVAEARRRGSLATEEEKAEYVKKLMLKSPQKIDAVVATVHKANGFACEEVPQKMRRL